MDMENKFGRTTELKIVANVVQGRTILEESFFTAPLKIMNPFYRNNKIMQVMQLSASAALMAGDMQKIFIEAKEGSCLEFTSQSYEKIHRMEDGEARRDTRIIVGKAAFLSYNPLPVIPFKGSAFQSSTEVVLEDKNSRFIMCDIISCGRYARGERFQYRYYKSLINIYVNQKLIYRDNTNFIPDLFDLEQIGLFEGYSHVANMVICNLNLSDDFMEKIRIQLEDIPKVSGGITRLESGDILIKVFGNNAQILEEICCKITREHIEEI